MKICIECKNKLSLNKFYIRKDRKNQYSSRCKKCSYNNQKEYNKDYSIKYLKKYRKSKKWQDYLVEYRKTEKYLQYQKEYRKTQKSKKYNSEYVKDKRKNDIQFLLSNRLRGRLRGAIKNNIKNGSAVKDLGCTLEELKVYLENKFVNGMSWDNRSQWHIDHIIPLTNFDLTKKEELKRACHYTNLQPLWRIENIKKSNKII